MSDAKIVPNVFLGFKKSVRYVSFSQYFVLFVATLKILRLYFERLSLGKPERWNKWKEHLRTLFTQIKTNTKTIGIYTVLGCCVLLKIKL